MTLDLDGLAASDALDLLLDLGHHEEIDLTTTQPAGFSTMTVGTRVEGADIVDVRIDQPNGGRTRSGVQEATQWLRFADEQARRARLPQAETRRRFLLAGAAEGRSDALVLSDTEFVYDAARRSNPLTAEQAAMLAGLFLRSRRHTDVFLRPGREGSSLGLQYFVIARAALPAAWRWWSACVATGQTPSGAATMGSAQAVLARFPRCIKARDEVMVRCLVPLAKSDQDAILYHLDAFLLMLGGAIDATALVANAAYSMPCRPYEVGWRRNAWRKELSGAAPALHTMTETGSMTRAVIDLVAEARNTIHGEPLQGVRHHGGDGHMHLVRLPPRVANKVVEHAKALGGATHWGIDASGADHTLLDPLRFVQVAIPFAAAALNELMLTTEVERLPGVDPSTLMVTPKSSGVYEPFEPRHVRRLQLLFGLSS